MFLHERAIFHRLFAILGRGHILLKFLIYVSGKVITLLRFQALLMIFPQIRPAAIIFSWDLQLRVLLEMTKFHLHKSVPGAGIIRNAGIIRGRVLFEEIRYVVLCAECTFRSWGECTYEQICPHFYQTYFQRTFRPWADCTYKYYMKVVL